MARIVWHSTTPWSTSGYGTQTAIWTQKLKEMGHEVVLSTYFGLAGTPMEWNGMPVLPGFGAAYCSPSLQQHAKHVEPGPGDDPGGCVGDWTRRCWRRLPVAHWLPSDCRPMSSADRNVVEAAGPQLIAMSRFGQARFKAAGFCPAATCRTASDLDVWQPPEDRAALRERHGIGPDTFVIGVNAANNDAIRKALPEMMLAFARFLKDRPDSLLALHTGVHQDGGQDLEAVAENLGITDRCKVAGPVPVHGGADSARRTAGLVRVPRRAVRGHRTRKGSACRSSRRMACGVPVITTRCSSMEELNPDGITGGRGAVLERRPPGVVDQAVGAGLYEAFMQALRGP